MRTLVPFRQSIASPVRLNPLTDVNWDEKLAGFSEATFFHTAHWAKVLNSTYGFTPEYVARTLDGEICSIFPLMEVDSPITGRRGVALPFTDRCSALTKSGIDHHGLWDDVVSMGKKRAWKYIECRGTNGVPLDAPRSVSFFSHSLDLGNDATQLFEGCHESTRRAVRKSEQSGLTVEFTRSLEGLREFYRLLCETRKHHGLPVQTFGFLLNIHRHVLAPDHGDIVLAKQGGRAVAGAIFFRYRKVALYKFGASDRNFQQVRANNLVMWEAIKVYSRQGYERLDFGRTSAGNDGLRRFKLGWGTRETTLDYFRYLPRAERFSHSPDNSTGWHNRVFRLLPVPVLRAAGAILYKHVA